MRTSVIIPLLAAISVVSCEPPMPPTDKEMIRIFNTHETAFHTIHKLISEGTEGTYYYPPYRPDTDLPIFKKNHGTPYERFKLYGQDTLYLKGLPPSAQMRLDSLLKITGCDLIHFYRDDQEAADSALLILTMVYYSHGIVGSGTSKCFVYNPELRNHPVIRLTRQGDLNEIYRRTYNDTTLYKPIKGNWYIELDHER